MRKLFREFGLCLFALLLIPKGVLADEISDEFKTILNADGKLVINSIAPTRMEESWVILNEYVSEKLSSDSKYFRINSCNDNYTECRITLSSQLMGDGETHSVGIKYNYDENVKKVIDGYANSIPASLENFSIRDLEIVNYWVNGKDNIANLINYSSELKSYFNYKNFNIDLRQGENSDFFTFASGIAQFKYDNTLYKIRNNTGVRANHVIYVSNDTASNKEALVSAVQERIDKYLGKEKVVVTAGDKTILEYETDYYDAMIAEKQALLDEVLANPSDPLFLMKKSSCERELENAQYYKQYFLDSYNNVDGDNYFLKDAEGDWYFIAKVGNLEHLFIVMKDSSKMVSPKLITSDFATDIIIESNGNVPLDTLIKANVLTSGNEYEKIIKLLGDKDNATFDLRLHSGSLDKYITKLENGDFQVKIPVPDKFNGKTLVIYYVDENDKVIEYEVEVKDNYAIFTTNHFSIYTLAEKNVVENPKTLDSLMNMVILSFVSLVGVVLIVSKKKLFN